MFDNLASRQDCGFQRTYEDRFYEIQRHIWQLQDAHERLSAASQRLHASCQHSREALDQLIASIRNTTNNIRHYIAEYVQAVEDWDVVIDEFRLREDNSSWARIQLNQHAAFFQDPSLAPSLEAKFRQLLQVYHKIQDDAEMILIQHNARGLDNVHLQATPSGRSAPSHNDGNEHLLGGGGTASDRPEPSHTDGDGHSTRDSTLSSPPAARVPQPPFRDRATAHFYSHASTPMPVRPARAASTAGSRSAAATQPAPAKSPPHTSFRGRRTTFVNSTYHRSASSRPVGIMTYADGNIEASIPMAWHTSPLVGATVFAAPVTPTAPTGHNAAGTTVPDSTRSSSARAPPAALAPTSSPAAGHHRPSLHTTFVSATHPPASGGRGAEAASSGPLLAGADGRPFAASMSTGPHGSAATPVDFGEDFGSENSSAFYRNATYNRTTTTPSQPALILKELPLDPFEGNIRQYPRFRNRFLEIVEAQYLRGEPHRLANGFQLTDSNYFTVVNLLEERYGNTDVIRNLLMQDLIAIRPPSLCVADLRRFHDEAFRVTTELKQLGDNVDATRLYEQSLMAKLSPALKTELIRNSDYAVKKSVSSILQGLRKYIQVLELTNNSGILWQSNAGQSSSPSSSGAGRPRSPYRQDRPSGSSHRPPVNGQSNQRTIHGHYAADADTILIAEVQEAAQVCPLCSRNHIATSCSYYVTIYMRIWRANKLGLCSLCLEESHRSESCPLKATYSCTVCNQGHHEALCPRMEGRSPPGADRRRTMPTNLTPARQEQATDPRHPRLLNPVHRGDLQGKSTAAERAPPSAQMSSSSNLTIIPERTWTKD